MNDADKSKRQLIDEIEVLRERLARTNASSINSDSERKRMEDALLIERDMMRALMDTLPDTIYFKDTKSRFTLINNAQAKMLGIENASQAIGKTDFDFFVTDHANLAFADEKRIIDTGSPLINKIEKVSRPDGATVWFSATKVPIVDKNGAVTGTVGVSRDITKMKQFDDELQKAKTDLEARVADRTSELQKANEELKENLDQLDFLSASSYKLAQTIQLDELLLLILTIFASRFPGSHVCVCKTKRNAFKCANATEALNNPDAFFASEKALAPFLEKTSYSPVVVSNWLRDDRLSHCGWSLPDDCPCYIAIPLCADNQCLGAVQIFTTQQNEGIYKQEEALFSTLASHAAACLSNAVHYLDLGEKARLDGELEAARSIQRRFTPQFKPLINHVDIKGVYFPAYEVGGDYLDYFQTINGDWIIVIADVCGKGIPAALLMTMLRSTFRVQGRAETSAKNLLCSVNEFMTLNLDDRSFVTALCLIIKNNGKSMSYARAGHPVLLKLSSKGEAPQPIASDGLALCLVSDTNKFNEMMVETTVPLKKGDRFLIYTDGLTDAINPERNTYGIQRLYETLSHAESVDSEALIDIVMSDIKKFTQHAPNHDDLTILAMHVTE